MENFAVKSFVFLYQDLIVRQLNPLDKNKEWCRFFNMIILNYQLIEYRHTSKKRLYSNVDVFSVARVILFNTYKIYKRFYLFQGSFKLLKYLKHLCQRQIKNLLKRLKWRILLKVVKSFQRKIHLRYLASE